jgi:hypothetical protein
MITQLYNESKLMAGLQCKTIELIHCTNEIKPIKALISLHDLIEINLAVESLFKDHKDAPIWDRAALQEISNIRRSLLVYYRPDFKPVSKFDTYNKDLIAFFNLLALRHNNQSLA